MTMLRSRMRLTVVTCVVLLAAVAASARVISYSPYSDRVSIPAVQHRLNRYFVLVEGLGSPSQGGPQVGVPVISGPGVNGQVVLYDSTGAEEPRVVFPDDESNVVITLAAARQNANGQLTILVQSNANWRGFNPQRQYLFFLSKDSGASWTRVFIPDFIVPQTLRQSVDVGGPIVRGRHSLVRIGTAETPFVIEGTPGVYAIDVDANARLLVTQSGGYGTHLLGSSLDGARMILRTAATEASIVRVSDGARTTIGAIDASNYEGWITSTGDVYLESIVNNVRQLYFYRNGTRTLILGPYQSIAGAESLPFFAVPTADYNGAWMIQRAQGRATTLWSHTAAGGLVKHWEDLTGPQIEALIAGESGRKLLIQVHRPRPQPDQRLFIDPALAVWTIGQTAPTVYDELFLNEEPTKGFVHVDVDRIETGELFVFDSGARFGGGQGGGGVIISPSPGGGSDVVQEWGVVRGSLLQRLVLPGISRIAGAFNSFWQSDVIVYNPFETSQAVTIRYKPTGEGAVTEAVTTITLQPREIRLIPDALRTLFNLESGGGAFFVTPARGVNMTSRTYNRTSTGTYGFGMNAIDVFAAAASPRFPVSFSGAFPGSNFRTNLIVTDTSGRGADASLIATGSSGLMGFSHYTFGAPAAGQQQLNNVGLNLGLLPSDSGALLFQPSRGESIASVIAIDNRTNDATYFPPDLPAPVVRTIPVIGHVDGANNSRFRSDLYLYNPSAQTRQVTLQVKAWDQPEQPRTLNLTLLPNEARVIRDVLFTAFGQTGLARLRYTSVSDSLGVRVTSRTYSIDENGGTYGFLMPPLNNFQAAGPGDTLEILGAVGGASFRTNVGFVELTAFPAAGSAEARVEIVDDHGRQIDSFSVTLPIAGGLQINDLFAARNLSTTGPILIRIRSVTGSIGAYATMVDNGTNDANYLAANLAATQ